MVSRRQFLKLLSLAATGLTVRCAANPVTGESQLMLVSEDSEIQMDKKFAPHQFSTDLGVVQDTELNTYLNQVGKSLASRSHRPGMPYSFRAVNAAYINAYAFPGGSITCTRGILLTLSDEGELAALLGHELGHVNARHTAHQMSQGTLISALAVGVGAAIGTQNQDLGNLAGQLGMVGAGMLLASYSRDNERQADALAMDYMVRSGYHPQGAVGLMDMLRKTSKEKPDTFQLMFATHPMSEERYQNLKELAYSRYKGTPAQLVNRERYLDQTARLRSLKGAIMKMQNGGTLLAQKKITEAEGEFRGAVNLAPNDYGGLILLSRCLLIQKKVEEALVYSERAKKIYPQEAQAHQLAGIARIQKKDFPRAFEDFSRVEKNLPGNPMITFFKGYSLDGMNKKKEAAGFYTQYLREVDQGDEARHAYKRLVEWGYIKPKR